MIESSVDEYICRMLEYREYTVEIEAVHESSDYTEISTKRFKLNMI